MKNLIRELDYIKRNIDFGWFYSNESSNAIMDGLQVSEGDEILAILGSGKQPFKMISKGARVMAVDKNALQIDYVNLLIQLLLDSPRKFLDYVSEWDMDKSDVNGLISNLDHLTIQEQNITQAVKEGKKYSKIYLSNVYEYLQVYGGGHPIFFHNCFNSLRSDGLLYSSSDSIDYFLSREEFNGGKLGIEIELTQIANKLEFSSKSICEWRPIIYRKLMYN